MLGHVYSVLGCELSSVRVGSIVSGFLVVPLVVRVYLGHHAVVVRGSTGDALDVDAEVLGLLKLQLRQGRDQEGRRSGRVLRVALPVHTTVPPSGPSLAVDAHSARGSVTAGAAAVGGRAREAGSGAEGELAEVDVVDVVDVGAVGGGGAQRRWRMMHLRHQVGGVDGLYVLIVLVGLGRRLALLEVVEGYLMMSLLLMAGLTGVHQVPGEAEGAVLLLLMLVVVGRWEGLVRCLVRVRVRRVLLLSTLVLVVLVVLAAAVAAAVAGAGAVAVASVLLTVVLVALAVVVVVTGPPFALILRLWAAGLTATITTTTTATTVSTTTTTITTTIACVTTCRST